MVEGPPRSRWGRRRGAQGRRRAQGLPGRQADLFFERDETLALEAQAVGSWRHVGEGHEAGRVRRGLPRSTGPEAVTTVSGSVLPSSAVTITVSEAGPAGGVRRARLAAGCCAGLSAGAV